MGAIFNEQVPVGQIIWPRVMSMRMTGAYASESLTMSFDATFKLSARWNWTVLDEPRMYCGWTPHPQLGDPVASTYANDLYFYERSRAGYVLIGAWQWVKGGRWAYPDTGESGDLWGAFTFSCAAPRNSIGFSRQIQVPIGHEKCYWSVAMEPAEAPNHNPTCNIALVNLLGNAHTDPFPFDQLGQPRAFGDGGYHYTLTPRLAPP